MAREQQPEVNLARHIYLSTVMNLVRIGMASFINVGSCCSFNLDQREESWTMLGECEADVFQLSLTLGAMMPGKSLVGSIRRSTSTPGQ